MIDHPNVTPFSRRMKALVQRLQNRIIEWRARRAGGRTVPKAAPAEAAEQRRHALRILNALAHEAGSPTTRYRRVLVDGMWENANYWTRYTVFRAGLGLVESEEFGMLGAYNRAAAEEAFSTLGFAGRADYYGLRRAVGSQRKEAKRLLAGVRSADDLLHLDLPYGLPPEIVYDGLLKRQRCGMVDILDPLLVDYLAEALQCLQAAHRLFEREPFDLVALSHTLNFDFGSLAWCGAQAGAEVVALYGDFGTARFQRIRGRSDLLKYMNCPTPAEVAAPDETERERRVLAGERYLEHRLQGASGDLSALYAYQKRQGVVTRDDIARTFGWDAGKPIVCVFASNWFDFPHSSNMNNFRDFRDWIEATFDAAAANGRVNWLFKAHPCDAWYGAVNGPTVADIIAATPHPHVRLVDESWNGQSLMQVIDAGITYFGTIGIELPAFGKPVLVADDAWYAPHGFVVRPDSREHYLAVLGREWWQGFDRESASRRAKEFAAWFFCDAEWHGNYHLRDDSEQYLIYRDLPEFLIENTAAVHREIEMIGNWMASGHSYFHTYKMLHSRVAVTKTPRRAVDRRSGETGLEPG